MSEIDKIASLLGKEADSLLNHVCKTIPKETIRKPTPNYVEESFFKSNRNNQTLRSLQTFFSNGRLKGTPYTSILPVDQGIEHTAGASFAPNPMYFNPENIIKLGIEGGCSVVCSTFGVLALHSRKYAHKVPFMVKINHNELMTYPNKTDQIMYGTVREAWNLGAVAIGATVYFGAAESNRQLMEVAEAFEQAHELGMATVLWCYTRNNGFKKDGVDYHNSTDISSQATHLGVTIQADLIKQKMPELNGGMKAIGFAKYHEKMYTELSSDHPIDLCRYMVLNCYAGQIGLINSGGESKGAADLADAVRTAVINKRAGGLGLILGRKAFQKPFKEGVDLLKAIQDVYLDKKITLA
ncbi:MAG: class I fructose-bisphosphate aldolase [Cytophagales bacterium]|nr:class I fructose-bisphosphate aldolase [Cytophagales bacterium]